jgi:hypothetical protein
LYSRAASEMRGGNSVITVSKQESVIPQLKDNDWR